MTATRAIAACGCPCSGVRRPASASAANYTLSRCYGLEMGTAAQFGATYTDPTNPDNDRGYCDQDRTHIANATVGIETPQFGNAILRAIASNWGVSAILTARSGARFSVITGVDTAFSGISNQRANQVSDDVYGNTQEDAQGRLANYLNREAFARAGAGHCRHQRTERACRSELLERHQRRVAPADFADGYAEHRAADRGLQPAEQLQLGHPGKRPDIQPGLRSVRSPHDAAGRPAHHAVRDQVRV